jgi:hypothetical protein
MRYHDQKLFRPEYRPEGFCYAIRRPDHYPEGLLAIEDISGEGLPVPLPTTVRRTTATRPMRVKLNAATEISFMGERYLHASVLHQFSGVQPASLQLAARARQFSSFILMVGSLSSADEFSPSHAVIVQNKDDLKIPLLLE